MLKFKIYKKIFTTITLITLLFTLASKLTYAHETNIQDQTKPANTDKTTANNNIVVDKPYVKFNPTGENAAAYLTIKNQHAKKIKLLTVQTDQPDLIKKIEIHDHIITDKIAKMVHLKRGLKIKPNSEIELKEGGKHIMLLGTNQELIEKAENIKLKLNFMIDGKNVEISENFEIKKDAAKKCCCKHK